MPSPPPRRPRGRLAATTRSRRPPHRHPTPPPTPPAPSQRRLTRPAGRGHPRAPEQPRPPRPATGSALRTPGHRARQLHGTRASPTTPNQASNRPEQPQPPSQATAWARTARPTVPATCLGPEQPTPTVPRYRYGAHTAPGAPARYPHGACSTYPWGTVTRYPHGDPNCLAVPCQVPVGRPAGGGRGRVRRGRV